MATSYTPYLELPMHDPEDNFNILLLNEAAQKTDAAMLAAAPNRAAVDLLDNSDFSKPINQQEKTSYNGSGYTIDRWRQSNVQTTTTIGSGYVRFAASGGYAYPRQYVLFRIGMYGKWYTAAVKTLEGNIVVASAQITADAVENEVTLASGTISDGVTLRLTKSSGDRICVRFDIADGKSVSLLWAALYEGRYTADTLPNYVAPKPAADLLECRQYFRRTKADGTYSTIGVGMAHTTTEAWINVPRTGRMRIAKPTVTLGGTTVRVYAGSSVQTVQVSSITVDKISDSYIRLSVPVTGVTNGAALIMTSNADGDFYLDENANL